MPAVIPIALGVGSAVAGIYGAKKNSEATDNAATLKAKADAAALALATQQEATRKQEYDQQQALLKQQYDAEQQIRAPYRAAGANALSNLGNILGVDFGQGYTGPTPSNPGTFGQPTPPATPTQSGQPGGVSPSAVFNNGAAAIQQQINGLPAAAGGAPTSTPQSTGTPTSTTTSTSGPQASTNPTDEAGILAALTKQYGDLNVKPTGPGTGATDINYYAQKISETGGLTQDNINFWFGPTGRIASDLSKSTGGGAAKTPTSTSLTTPTSLAPPLNITPLGGVGTPGYSPIIPISGLMGRGPYQ